MWNVFKNINLKCTLKYEHGIYFNFFNINVNRI